MDPIIISFYTLKTPYEDEVKNLIRSCKMWNLQIDIEGIASEGSWEKNCALKPQFILRKIQEHKRPVLWVDADAVFKRCPDFKDFENCDFAVRVNEFLPELHESRIISNTIFVRNAQSSFEILEKWKALAEMQVRDEKRIMEFWDQRALADVLQSQNAFCFEDLPLKYCKIFDSDDLFISDDEVIIEHYQASRRLKHKVHPVCKDHCCR